MKTISRYDPTVARQVHYSFNNVPIYEDSSLMPGSLFMRLKTGMYIRQERTNIPAALKTLADPSNCILISISRQDIQEYANILDKS